MKLCRAENCTNERDTKRRSTLCTMHRVRMSRHKSLELPEKEKLPEGIVYACQHHGQRTVEESYLNLKDGYYSCLLCRRISEAKMKEKHPDYHHTQTRNFYFFGKELPKLKILVKDYNEILEQQNGLCKICKEPETMKAGKCRKYERGEQNKKSAKRLAIDHCHFTWNKFKVLKIRGLLCHRCNTGIGSFYDSTELLQSAIDYLKSHS